LGETRLNLLSLEMDDLLRLFVSVASAKALAYLGESPEEEARRDLEKARLAIDTTIALVGLLAPRVEEGEGTQLRQMVAGLQFAYARAAK